jgi:hypothetical protein
MRSFFFFCADAARRKECVFTIWKREIYVHRAYHPPTHPPTHTTTTYHYAPPQPSMSSQLTSTAATAVTLYTSPVPLKTNIVLYPGGGITWCRVRVKRQS